MKMERASWDSLPKQISETISDPNKFFYGGLSCDVWVYSWVIMENQIPDWVSALFEDESMSRFKSELKWGDDIEPLISPISTKGDEYLVIMKDKGVSLQAYNMTGLPLISSPEFEWGIADTVEAARAVIKSDQRLQRELLELIGDEDALVERN